jgi:hypothetical protein
VIAFTIVVPLAEPEVPAIVTAKVPSASATRAETE